MLLLLRSLRISLAVSLVCWFESGLALHAAEYEQVVADSIKPYLANHLHAAVTVGIVDSEGTHVFGFGRLDREDPKSQPNGKTIYQIGSITKVFTTTLLAEQVVLGRMKLEDPAQKYLPSNLVLPKEKERQITLEELATHRSGLPKMPLLAFGLLIGGSLSENPYAAITWKQLEPILPLTWFSSPIGKSYNYSNLGIGLLAEAVVHASESPSYAELVAERVAKPLSLTDTVLTLSEKQASRLAQGYTALDQPTVAWDFPALEGCGALYSMVDDLLAFAAANLGFKTSPLAEAMKLAQAPRKGHDSPTGAMGLGWHHLDYNGIPMIWHNGAVGGYTSMIALLPTKKTGIVMLSNTGDPVDPYCYVLIDLLFPQSIKSAAE